MKGSGLYRYVTSSQSLPIYSLSALSASLFWLFFLSLLHKRDF